MPLSPGIILCLVFLPEQGKTQTLFTICRAYRHFYKRPASSLHTSTRILPKSSNGRNHLCKVSILLQERRNLYFIALKKPVDNHVSKQWSSLQVADNRLHKRKKRVNILVQTSALYKEFLHRHMTWYSCGTVHSGLIQEKRKLSCPFHLPNDGRICSKDKQKDALDSGLTDIDMHMHVIANSAKNRNHYVK